MYKVLISDNLAMEAQKLLRETEGIELDAREKVSHEELIRIIPEYDALIIRSASQISKDVLEAAKKLRIIGRAGVGVDNVDVPDATRRGIVVMNTPDGNTISTAEHTFSMMLAMARNIPQAHHSMRQGKWERKNFMGTEVFGKCLGIIGLGRIGTELAKRAQAFGMQIMAYDPFLTTERAEQLKVQLTSLDDIFSHADFISVHTPKSKETENLINSAVFNKMKKNVRIINCARGGIINQADLIQALKDGRIAGAALDVYEKEPPEEPELLTAPNLILTPHLGASTEEAQNNVGIVVAEQVRDALLKGSIRNALNIPSLPGELFKELAPFIELADRLGRFQAQIMEGQLKKVTVQYAGEVTQNPVDLVTSAALRGLLASMLSSTINFVNARFIAKERGIEVVETTSSDPGDFATTLTILVETEKDCYEITGTLIGKKRDPYVVSVLGYHTDFIPQGHLLVFRHKDEPGIVGRMGSILGDARINIAALHMGRNEVGGDAVSILTIDSEASSELIEKLRQAATIRSMKAVNL